MFGLRGHKEIQQRGILQWPKGGRLHTRLVYGGKRREYSRSQFKLFHLQGARWDVNTGVIVESKLKELHPSMPIMFIKAVSQEINVKIMKDNSNIIYYKIIFHNSG